MSSNIPLEKDQANKSKLLAWIKHELNVLFYSCWTFCKKWWISSFIVLSTAAFAIPPIWYSAWFPDAQQFYFNELEREAKTDEEKKHLKKPNIFQVSTKYVDDFSTPAPWLLICTIFYFIGQFKQIRIFSEIGNLKNEIEIANENLEASKSELSDYKIQARKELSEEKNDHADTRRHYAYSVKQELQNVFTQYGWFDENDCRLSLYTFDKNQNSANLIHRYCRLSIFEKVGRLSIPATDGVIAAALNNGDSVWVRVLQHSKREERRYIAAVRRVLNDEYGVSVADETFVKVRMKSSLYYCRSIKRQNGAHLQKFAVFVVESTNPDAFKEDSLNEIFTQRKDQIYRMVDHLSRLEAVMNPIKETV